MVWSILDVGRADQIKTAKVTVKEGTQKDELILDLIQGLGHIDLSVETHKLLLMFSEPFENQFDNLLLGIIEFI